MPEPDAGELAGAWLVAAEQDLGAARATLAQRISFIPRHTCFSAQQAAEKAIKALVIAVQVDFPFDHDLAKLLGVLSPGERPSFAEADLDWLTQWALAWRYPGEVEASWQDAERAVAIADDVVTAARATLPAP